MNKKTRLKLLVSIGLSVFLAALIFSSVNTRFYQILELKALDLRFALKGRRPAISPVVHIDIDDQSLAALGRWPWPRNYHAKLTSILKECQAKQVLMDILFTEEWKDNPEEDAFFTDALCRTRITYLPFYFSGRHEAVSGGLKSLLLKDISLTLDDAAKLSGVDPLSLKDTFSQTKKVVLDEVEHDVILNDPEISFEAMLEKIEKDRGWFLFAEDENYLRERFQDRKLSRDFILRFAVRYTGNEWPFAEELAEPYPPIASYTSCLKGSGYINADPDLDGVTRRVPLFLKHEDKIFPQLTVAALLDLMEVKQIDASSDKIILKGAHLRGLPRDIVIPVDKNGSVLVNWTGRWGEAFQHIPYYMIIKLAHIREEINAVLGKSTPGADNTTVGYLKKGEEELMKKLTQMVKGKICIIGLTATGTHDLRAVPLQENYPMVGTHSNLIDTILAQEFIIKKDGFIRIFIFIFTAIAIAFASMMKMWKSLLFALAYLAGYFLFSLFLFRAFGIWVDLVGPVGIVVFGFSSITSFRFFTEEKEKLWIKQAFSHYLSGEVISELLNDPSKLKLGGERRMLTVIFSDVRGFTTFSESHQPEEVVAMLNEILTEQVKVVFKYNGTLDKFVGDELMAFFGAPGNRHLNDHALVAVRTAVEIQARMAELRQKWVIQEKEPLQIGIGINTGEMVVGNMGSAERMDYTVIGDNVNLGARLCSAASREEIIISQVTYDLVADHVVAEKLEPISVKGKSKPIPIYRVTGLKKI